MNRVLLSARVVHVNWAIVKALNYTKTSSGRKNPTYKSVSNFY